MFRPPVPRPYLDAKKVLKPDPRGYRHQKFVLRGEKEEAMEKILRQLIDQGLLEPCCSRWASSCLVVPNKVTEERRLVVDYRGLNAQTQHESYTLPSLRTCCRSFSGGGSSPSLT